MGYSATITKTGQITLPKWVRETLGVKTGERVVFRKEKKEIRLEKEKTAEEIAKEIDALIPDDIREYHMKNYAGMNSAEMQEKWEKSTEGIRHFREEMERTL